MTSIESKEAQRTAVDHRAPVLHEVREGVGVVTLNRPEKRNAVSPEMYELFNAAMHSHQLNPEVKAILIVSNGPAFCAGGDLEMIDKAKSGAIDSKDLDLNFLQPELISKPIVCGVAGPCVGEGVAIVLASDLVICGESARFALPEVGLGIPPVDIPLLAARRLNANYVLEILLTGDWKTAAWADKVGLVNDVVPDEAVCQTAFALARKIVALPGLVVTLVKSLVYQARVSDDPVVLRQQSALDRAKLLENSGS